MGYSAREPAIIVTFNKILDKIQHKIIRDFYEIEYLQKSKYFPQKFVNNLEYNTHDKIIENLRQYYPDNGIILNGEEITEIIPEDSKFTDYFIINSLSEKNNLGRSLPFISNSLTLIHDYHNQKNVIATVINFPILNITLNTHKDTEVFCNNKRIYISQNNDANNTAIITNIDNGGKNTKNEYYNFNSIAYEALLIFQNKADLLIKHYDHKDQLYPLEFIANKANFTFSLDEKKKIVKIANNKTKADI